MNYAVFDIESENWIRIRALGFYDGTAYKEFAPAYTPREQVRLVHSFLDHIDNKRYKGFRIYAHNGGRFDFLFLLEEMFKRSWNMRFIERGGRIVAIYVRTKKTEFHFADSYALLSASLDSLGKAFAVEHQKSHFDFEEGKKLRVTKKLLSYLENDCLCLYEVLTKFFENEWIEKPALTIASQSLSTFKEKFQQGELHRIDLPYEELFRESFYSGGRVEVYKGYGKNVTCFDVNSLYPSAMLEAMPCGEMKQTRAFVPGKIGFYKVEIRDTPKFYISPLLVKKEHRNYYVNGKGEYFLSSATLNFLRTEYGIRFKVLFGFVFPRKEHLFNDYVRTFYKIKQENKGNAMYFVAKFMLNSLYGKLGQSRFRESAVTWNKSLSSFRTDDVLTPRFGLVFVRNDSRSKFVLPYLASYITELARLKHFQIMRQKPESVYYCDTDSLYTDSPRSFSRFVGSDIGQLSREGSGEGIFLAPKCYAIREGTEEKIRFKGFQTDSFSFKDFEQSLKKGKVLTQRKKRMLSFREASKRVEGIEETQSAFLKLVTQQKKASLTYDRRRILPDRKHIFNTEPFNFEEIA